MPGAFIANNLKHFYNTRYHADTCTYNGQSFGVQFYIEESPSDMAGNIIENASAWFSVQTKNVADIKPGVLVTIGTAPDDGAGSGFAGDMIIDLDDTTHAIEGVRQLYVIRVAEYGDDGLQKQVFLSRDKP